jgi:hypothetical protein
VHAADLQNIWSVVTIALEPSSPDYKRWRDLVLLTLRCYALDNHVFSDIADPSVYWARLESIMVTWILGTLSPEHHEIVWEPMETARQAWLAIDAQFLGNNESRVLQLDARFYAFKQGDLIVSDYCRRMKGIPDDLHVLDETVIDCHLVLNLLQGLDKRFDHMKIFIKRSQPFHLLPHCLQWPQTWGDQVGPLGGLGTGLRVLLHALRWRTPSVAAAASTPTTTGTVVSSGGPSPSYPQPQQWRQRQG